MLKIARIPAVMQPFFNQAAVFLSVPQMAHFSLLVLGLVLTAGRGNVSALSRLRTRGAHRTKVNEFLTRSNWDSATILQRVTLWLLERARRLPARKGELDTDILFLVIDETKQGKRGKKMAGRSKVYVPSQKRYIKGTIVVEAVLVFRGITLPWAAELYLPKKEATRLGIPFVSQIDLAVQMIAALPDADGLRVFVLFDSFYACKAVVQAVRARKWDFISVAKSNRVVITPGPKPAGKNRTVATYMAQALRHGGSWVHLGKGRRKRSYRVAVKNAGLRGIRSVRFVFSTIVREGKQRLTVPKPLALITSATELNPKEVIRLYQYRWSIELFFAEVKQRLGWSQYQTRSLTGSRRHLHLVNLAHALLTHLRLTQGEGAQAAGRQITIAASSRMGLWALARQLVTCDLIRVIQQYGVETLNLSVDADVEELMKAA